MSKSILFQFKDPVTLAGEQIQGICYVRIPEEMPKVQMVLLFQTKEYSKVLEKKQIPYDESNPQMIPEKLTEKQQQVQITLDSPLKPANHQQKKYELNGNILYRIIRHYGIHDSFMYTQELYTGNLKPGDYKFPFSIPTQFNMPSSFYYKSTDGFKQAKCGYKISLKIDSSDEAKTLMQESTDVYINGRFYESEQYRVCEGNIVQLLCLNSGTVELSMKLKNNKFKPGDSVQVEYTIDNTRSQKAISRIEAKIINKLTFIDNDEIERIIEDKKILTENWDGVEAGQKKDRVISQLLLPKDLKASLKTSNIKNQYFLQLEAIANAFLTQLSVPVVCQIPIHITEQQLPQIVKLDGWNFVPIMNVSVNAFSNMTVQQSYIP